MSEYQQEKLLILTKTYPVPSKSYRETVCVAAVNSLGDFRRLYPIQYRFLEGDRQFKRWQWIQANVVKSSDKRPESYNINNDTIVLQEILRTENGWDERLNWIKDHIYPSFNSLEQSRIDCRTSMGIIKPSNFSLIVKPTENPDWSPAQLTALRTEGFFDPTSGNKKIVRKLPYDFYYEYSTDEDSLTYRHMITDWEVGALFWRCQRDYGNNWEEKLREKLESDFRNRSLLLLLGTMHRFPNQWLIIGLIYPPSLEFQEMLIPVLSDL